MEVEGGFRRLGEAGLLRVNGAEIFVTEEGRRLCDEALSTTQYILEGTDNVHRALQELAGQQGEHH